MAQIIENKCFLLVRIKIFNPTEVCFSRGSSERKRDVVFRPTFEPATPLPIRSSHCYMQQHNILFCNWRILSTLITTPQKLSRNCPIEENFLNRKLERKSCIFGGDVYIYFIFTFLLIRFEKSVVREAIIPGIYQSKQESLSATKYHLHLILHPVDAKKRITDAAI